MGSGPSTLGPGQFTKEQLAQLRAKFFRASRGRRAASIDDLRALPELAGNPLVPRIFSVLDIDGDGKLDLEEFIRAAGGCRLSWGGIWVSSGQLPAAYGQPLAGQLLGSFQKLLGRFQLLL